MVRSFVTKQWSPQHLLHALACKEAVYAACLALVRRKDEADDLFQETYLRAFRFFHQFTPGTNCRAWLLTIMYNVFRNHYPQRVRDQQMLDIERVTNEYEERLFAEGDTERHDVQRDPLTHQILQVTFQQVRKDDMWPARFLQPFA